MTQNVRYTTEPPCVRPPRATRRRASKMMLAFSCMALRQPPRSALRPSRSVAHGLSRCAAHSVMTAAAGRKRVVFLGTPACAARSLELLIAAANEGRSDFELVAVVSTPPVKQGRKMRLTNSPVQDMAEAAELPVLTPPNAKDETFLAALAELQPDLCITAAYGCFLPQRFLDMPKFGTLNIHPSLLPLYRGAAPLQRCLEAGDEVGGVTVAFTVLKMDAGPVLRQQTRSMAGEEHFPELLTEVCCMWPRPRRGHVGPLLPPLARAPHGHAAHMLHTHCTANVLHAQNVCQARPEPPRPSPALFTADV